MPDADGSSETSMDLVATLRSKIERLPAGDHTLGLRSVLSHIETAFRHLLRGQNDNDDSAFTDVIYRCNQAFEGSIKEAYRALAGQDPQTRTPFQIETYLENENVFRERVLAQFTNYRTEWRNPSTHDYKLNFDESESFLAIVSVSAFACVLIDQIAGRLAYVEAVKEVDEQMGELKQTIDLENASLIEVAIGLFQQFSRLHQLDSSIQTEIQLMGALAGFLSSVAPTLNATLDYRLSAKSTERGDLLLATGNERVLVELKRTNSSGALSDGVNQLQKYMSLTRITEAILFVYPPHGGELVREDRSVPKLNGRLVVLRSPECE